METQNDRKYYKLTKAQLSLILGACFTIEHKKVFQSNLIPLSFYVEKDFDIEAMEKAFNCLLERSDALRLQLVVRPGGLRQKINEFQPYHPKRITLKDKAAFYAYAKEFHNPIPLFSPILLYAELAECENKSGGIFLCMHHFVSDGYSMDLIAQKLDTYYSSYKRGEKPPEEKPCSIVNFFNSEDIYLKSGMFKKDRKYWFHQFNHQPRYSFPVGRIPWKCNLGTKELDIAGDDYRKLKQLSGRLNCSLPSVVMSFSALVVYVLHGDQNFSLFTLQHGRVTPALKKTIGCMYNTFPVFYDLQTDLPVTDFLQQSYTQYLEFMSHGRFPTSNQILMAAKETYIKRFGYNHLWCIFSNMGLGKYEMQELEQIDHPDTYLMGMFYCGLFDRPGQDTLHIELDYQNRCFTDERIDQILRTFTFILRKACDDPEQSLASLTASLTDAEKTS